MHDHWYVKHRLTSDIAHAYDIVSFSGEKGVVGFDCRLTRTADETDQL